jgi:predicted N-acyltransferase
MTGFVIDVADRVADQTEWDEVVQASAAPLFYRSDVLAAYHRYPLRETRSVHYLTARSTGGGLAAVLPAYVLPASDPLGVLPSMLPAFRLGQRPLLLSHVWHWYDTDLPARRLTAQLVEAVCARLRLLAQEQGCQAFGFINVPEGGALAGLLDGTILARRRVDARYTLDLRRFDSADDYLAVLRRRVRQEVKRHLRRAEQAGAQVSVAAPDAGDMAVVARLCQATASKHGNHGWYDPARLAAFVASVGCHTRLVAVRLDGAVVAASISFVDGRRFHNWAAGSVPLRELPFSPYIVLLYETVRAALSEGCTLLEGGRRNDSWKERLGLQQQALGGWVASV